MLSAGEGGGNYEEGRGRVRWWRRGAPDGGRARGGGQSVPGWSLYTERSSSPAERSLTGIDGPKRREAPSGDHSREE